MKLRAVYWRPSRHDMILQAGDSLGRYTIADPIGSGGMGQVYRAHDARLERPVAIKIIRDAADGGTRRRVLREARAASSLTHPCICTVYDVIDEGDYPFIVMELVEGRPLSSLIPRSGLSEQQAVPLARQVADALAYAHARGIVHRDLKAANVVVTSDWRPKVLDFGLAVAFGEAQNTLSWNSLELPGRIVGTPGYMSPQQLQGAPGDPRDDIWSFGVLLYEMLSGRRPFASDRLLALYESVLNDAPPRLPDRIAAPMRRLIDRCLAKSSEDRVQRSEDLIVELDTMLPRATAAAPSAAADEPFEVGAPPPITSSGGASALVGRERELTTLLTAWERARAGRRQLVLMAGEPGIGKTRLTTEFARQALADGVALFGRCDLEALMPYQPFVEALDWYARHCPQRVLETHFRQVSAGAELAQLVPVLGTRLSIAPAAGDVNAEGQRYRLFGAVATLLAAAARTRPVLLALDDVHWADRPTLMMLRHVMRATADTPLCIVGTYRDTDLDRAHPFAESLADLRREEGITRIVLRGLADGDVRKFVEGWVGSGAERLTDLVTERTEGNPFFMTEVLRHLRETGTLDRLRKGAAAARDDEDMLPEGVREVIGRRLGRLSETCNRVLAVAAVIGREFRLDVLLKVAEVTEDQLLDVVDEAATARLIAESATSHDRYAFTHALVRETLYGELATPRRVRLHRRVADALEALLPDRPPLADLAFHLTEAMSVVDAERAIGYAIRAADKATAGFALEEAARFYGMALQGVELLPETAETRHRRCGLHAQRSRAFGDAGLWAAAKQEAQHAIDLLGPDERVRRCELLVDMAKYSFWMLDIASVRRLAPEALSIAEEYGRDDLWADMTAWLGAAAGSDGDLDQAIALHSQAITRAGGIRSFALASGALAMCFRCRFDDAIEQCVQGVKTAREMADPPFRLYTLEHLGMALTGAGRYDEALNAFEEARQVGRQAAMLPILARGISMNAGLYTALGDYAQAEALALEARELAREAAFSPTQISSTIDLLFVYARIGDPARAAALTEGVSRVVASAAGWHAWLWRLRLVQAHAELALARGECATAIEHARSALELSRASKRGKYEALAQMTLSRALLATEDVRSASSAAAAALQIARDTGDPALRLRALVTHIAVDGSDALLREAKQSIDQILSNLSDPALRKRFVAGELVAPLALA